MCANIMLAGKLGIGFGNHRIDNSLLLDVLNVFTVVVMDIDLSDNEVNVHSIGNEVSFVLTSGSGKERIERKLRKSQINSDRLSLMFMVSYTMVFHKTIHCLLYILLLAFYCFM